MRAVRLRMGIIPARAGFTNRSDCTDPWSTDHPRSRGVYTHVNPGRHITPGSSPLARGLPDKNCGAISIVRIIPARAGFTFKKDSFQDRAGDHPRSRGVYQCDLRGAGRDVGSSPLARGLLIAAWRGTIANRIIPARAGFTDQREDPGRAAQDHPRSRGVYGDDGEVRDVAYGSSPLARGLQPEHGARLRLNGIIPARAGFTPFSSAFLMTMRDHPRSRGVYENFYTPIHYADGSSPLARGLRVTFSRAPGNIGIIPARAGFTDYSGSAGIFR